MDPPATDAAGRCEGGEEAKVVITCFAEFASEANLDGDDGGGDAGREYRRAKREDELKRRWISSVLAMAGREVDAGVVDPADGFYYRSVYPLHDSYRDLRHVSKTYPWHDFYNMSNLSPTPLGPMDHWNNCSNNGDGCEEEPYAMLQIFDIKVLPFTLDVTCPVEVYGIIAVRDDVDEYRRNYLFNRSRENPVIITPAYDSLPLMSPTRGISMWEACLIETDIRIKVEGEEAARDLTMVDGCVDIQEHRCGYDSHFKNRIDGELGAVLTHSMVIQAAVEATIQLEFRRLPAAAAGGGDFRVRMTGYTRARPSDHHHPDNTYVFAGDGRELDEIVVRADGELEHRFVAAVRLGDTLELRRRGREADGDRGLHRLSEGGRRLVLPLLLPLLTLPPPKKATPNAAAVATGNCKY
uniref:DUF6598 domain-containing protein n=1 Tax=Oryza nivara TaxID=4536 RepID=A0A0E0I8U0_ORYNI